MCGQKMDRVLSVPVLIASAANNPTQQYQFNQASTWQNKKIIGAFLVLQDTDLAYSTTGVELVPNTALKKGYLGLTDGSGVALARIPLSHLSVQDTGCCGFFAFSQDVVKCIDMNKSYYQFPANINTLVGTALNKCVEVHFVYEQL